LERLPQWEPNLWSITLLSYLEEGLISGKLTDGTDGTENVCDELSGIRMKLISLLLCSRIFHTANVDWLSLYRIGLTIVGVGQRFLPSPVGYVHCA